MRIENFSFQNRHDLNIVGEIWHPENSKGLAFIEHGVSGHRDQPQLQTMAKAFCQNGYTAVVFDATHSFGESDGLLENVTLTSHWQDYEDVIAWAKAQFFYREPFILGGFSLGGFSCLYLALKYPDKIKAVLPATTVISGRFFKEAQQRYKPQDWVKWMEQGFLHKTHRYKPEISGKICYSPLMVDWLTYDVLEDSAAITAPILLIVGNKDETTPLDQQQQLFEHLTASKKLVVIPGAPHTFVIPEHLDILEKTICDWLKTI